jgi:hypothetical protein
VAVAEFKRFIQIWNVKFQRCIAKFETTLDFGGRRLAITRDGLGLVVGAYHDHGVAFYETKSGAEVWRRNDLKKVQRIRVSNDDQRVWCGFEDESFKKKPFEMLNRVSGESEFALEGVADALESVHDDVIIIDGKDRGDFLLVDPEFKKVASIRRTTFAALDFAFAPHRICITESGGLVRCYDVNSGRQQWAYNPGNGIHALVLAYNEAQERFVAITWPYESGGDHQLITLSPHDGDVETLATISDACEFAFCRMGSKLISSDGKIRSSATGEVEGVLDFFPMTENAG